MNNDTLIATTPTGQIEYAMQSMPGFIAFEFRAEFVPTGKSEPRTMWVRTLEHGDRLMSHWNSQQPWVWRYYQP